MRSKLALLLAFLSLLSVPSAFAAADEDLARSYYNRGTGHYGKDDFDAAIRDLSKAIALEPKAPDAYYNRGWSYRRQHRLVEADADFSKAIELYPYQLSYYLSRANTRIVMNDMEGAVSDASIALLLAPDNSHGYFLRGVAYLHQGNVERALMDSVRCLQIEPSSIDARRLLYESLVKREARQQTPGAHFQPQHPMMSTASSDPA